MKLNKYILERLSKLDYAVTEDDIEKLANKLRD